MNKLTQICIAREAILKQQQAAQSLLEAAHLSQNKLDIQHMETHMHTLLKQSQRLTADYYAEFRKVLP